MTLRELAARLRARCADARRGAALWTTRRGATELWRARQRAIDREVLWPAIRQAALSHGLGLTEARAAFALHTRTDRAWQGLDPAARQAAIAALPAADDEDAED